jgi:hypothetical protein
LRKKETLLHADAGITATTPRVQRVLSRLDSFMV